MIDSSNYKGCAPNIINFNTTNNLEIKNKCTDSNYYNNSASDINVFYKATNSYEIFNTAMYKLGINGFNVNYKNLSSEKQILASQYYQNLLKYEDCDINALTGCTIDNISSWSAEQLITELDVLQTYALAIFLTEIEEHNSNHNAVFNYIDSLNLGIPEKGILLILYGNYKPSDLIYNDANSIVNYINNFDLSISEKSKILEYLGYRVDGDKIYW